MSLGPYDLESEEFDGSVSVSFGENYDIEAELFAIQGPVGPKGDQGEQGPPGDPGQTTYTHVQGTPSSSWDVQHNLGVYPNVTVLDSAGSRVEGDIAYIDGNFLVLTFASAFSGVAYLS